MTCYIKEARSTDISDLSHLIRNAYRDVADRFQLTPANCPNTLLTAPMIGLKKT
jgi:hypothetical protein